MYHAQVAMIAACINQQEDREADIEPRAAAYFTWLQAQPTTNAQVCADAQAALLAAAQSYDSNEGEIPVDDVLDRAATLLTDIPAMSGYPGHLGA